MSTTLKSIRLANFKSIRDQTIELGSMNVLIGANGSGKSNLLSFFKLLNEMIGERFTTHVETAGGANAILHYGAKKSPTCESELKFDTDTGESRYFVRFSYAAVDRLFFSGERIFFQRDGRTEPFEEVIPGGNRETQLKAWSEQANSPSSANTARVIRRLLSACRVFQFHDTSLSSGMRNPSYVDENRFLKPDGSNLASFLFGLQRDIPQCYKRIIKTLQQITPFFDDFELDPSAVGNNSIRLNWRERGSAQLFGPHQLSDGTLRAMALITLLLQPQESLPSLIVVDEPELGLHPAAIKIVAALMKQASFHCQVLIATQSTALLDEFEPTDVIVVDRNDRSRESVFKRLDMAEYEDWLDDYSLPDLWERNVIGGGPF